MQFAKRGRRALSRVVWAAISIAVVVALGYGVLAATNGVRAAGLISRAIVIRAALAATRVYDPWAELERAPGCNCTGTWAYRCDSAADPYYVGVRADPRLREVLLLGRQDLETYVAYREWLRGRFPHGTHSVQESRPWRLDAWNLLELVDEADRGERFLCGTASKMLAQMILAGGGFPRLVYLTSRDLTLSHVTTEAWIPDLAKWVVIDPDFDLVWVDGGGVALGALEIHALRAQGRESEIAARAGSSPNGVYRPERREQILSVYDSVAFDPWANWLAADYPWLHPRRHPSTRLLLWRSGDGGLPPLHAAEVSDDTERLGFTPCREPDVALGPGGQRVPGTEPPQHR